MITITHRVLEAFRVRLFSRSLVSDSFNPMGCSMQGFPVLHHLPEFAQIQVGDESVMPSNHPLLSCPLLLPSVFPSSNVFSSELVLCIRWPEYWSFSFSINPSNEYLGFSLELTDVISLQSKGLSSLFQCHSSKASILGTQPSFWSNSHIHM